MSATWCAGSPTNEYAGQGGHWYDPAGIAAPKPVANCVCPAGRTFGTHPVEPQPVRGDDFAQLVDEFVNEEDPHARYGLLSLVRWHVPTPWATWFSFTAARRAADVEVGRQP